MGLTRDLDDELRWDMYAVAERAEDRVRDLERELQATVEIIILNDDKDDIEGKKNG